MEDKLSYFFQFAVGFLPFATAIIDLFQLDTREAVAWVPSQWADVLSAWVGSIRISLASLARAFLYVSLHQSGTLLLRLSPYFLSSLNAYFLRDLSLQVISV